MSEQKTPTQVAKIRKRVCPKCKLDREEHNYPATRSKFFPGGRSIICITCLEKMVDYDDWNTVDKILQWLDLPFDINMWSKLLKSHSERALAAYFNLMETREEHDSIDWTDMTAKWKLHTELGTIETEVEFLSQDWLRRMETKWPGNYEKDDYVYLEQTHDRLCATQNIITGLQQENAKIITCLLLVIRQKIQDGHDVKKEIDSYNALVKASGFEATNAKNMGDFNSIGELARWLEKRNFQVSYANEKKDIIDFTIDNYQQYVKRVAAGEPNLIEQVERMKDILSRSETLEDELNQGKVNIVASEDIDYEDEEELEYELSEFDVRDDD